MGTVVRQYRGSLARIYGLLDEGCGGTVEGVLVRSDGWASRARRTRERREEEGRGKEGSIAYTHLFIERHHQRIESTPCFLLPRRSRSCTRNERLDR